MFAKSTLKGALMLTMCCAFAGCVGQSASTPNTTPLSTPVPGTFGTLAVANYDAWSNEYCTYETAPYPQYIFSSAQDYATSMKQGNWTQVLTKYDADVNVGSFGSSTQQYADAVYYAGHGDEGAVVLSADNSFWGVGSLSGTDDHNCPDSGNRTGMPLQGRLHWLMLASSDSAAGPQAADTGEPNWTADWRPAFGGSLHGIYGFWQHPNDSCASQGEQLHACDIMTSQISGLGSQFGNMVIQSTHIMNVHDAWVYAANTSSVNAGDQWAIWEDLSNRRDAISGPVGTGPNATPSGHVYFYYPQITNGISSQQVAVQNQTFNMSPGALNNEPINDSSEFSRIQQSDPSSTYSDNGTVRVAYNLGYTVTHFYSGSGAVTYAASSYDNALNIDQSTAQQAAISFVNQDLGLPSDAILTQTLQFLKVDPSSNTVVPIAWEFIWRHSAPVFGGDAIKVIIDDYETRTHYCSLPNPNDPPNNKPSCLQWSYQVSDSPHVQYAYRLWRTIDTSFGGVQKLSASRQSEMGQASIDAVTASYSLPPGTAITGYTSGYWTGSATDPLSTSSGAIPAWIFSSGGFDWAVDASTGALLGPA